MIGSFRRRKGGIRNLKEIINIVYNSEEIQKMTKGGYACIRQNRSSVKNGHNRAQNCRVVDQAVSCDSNMP